MVLEIDTTAIDTARAKLADLEDALLRAKGDASAVSIEPLPAQVGCFTIDPLESAIDQAVRLISECQGNQEVRLTDHLDRLLALQLKQLSEPVVVEHSQVGDLSRTEVRSGRDGSICHKA
ncbi:hypothetical protein ASF84_05390 [Pseudomonas sp. Leaf127]|nr:hypothetical protein ASF84_05390 [Pseudomonas sp. Leaf127]